MTLLESINSVLAALGQRPVTDPDSSHPSVIAARARIERVSKKLQSSGHWFNTNTNDTLAADVDGKVLLPENTLSAVPTDARLEYTQRGRYLYDNVNNTFVIGASVSCTLILLLDFSDLPEPAAWYITCTAIRDEQVDKVGDAQKDQKLAQDVFVARSDFQADNIKKMNLNAMNSPQAQRLLRGVRGSYAG
jgi:hypothetical protein